MYLKLEKSVHFPSMKKVLEGTKGYHPENNYALPEA
jgi:hypothetical protein